MHLTTLFQLTALAALLDPILAQTWTMSAYNTDTCADTSIFFTDSEDSTGSEGFGCHTFGSLAQAVQLNFNFDEPSLKAPCILTR
ncbi:MAG: hypothetical protein LQ352_004754 [Teloschistes flavicans]|nr:MAG: hypothetical protein LQ352_004754 [Teloschistes flavicans]